MPNAIFYNSYKLKKGSSVPDFLHAVEQLVTQYASKQKGVMSFMLFNDGDNWADYGLFETMEDARSFENPTSTNEYAEKFYSFLNFSTCKSRMYTVKGSHQQQSAVPKAVMYISFKLAKGVSESDFLQASEKVHSEFMSKQKGYGSWKQLTDGKTWADLLTWESIEDAQNAMGASASSAVAHEFFAFLDPASINSQLFSVEKYMNIKGVM